MSALASILFAALLAVGPSATPAIQNKTYGPPKLHVINHALLGPAYSCRPKAEFATGYQNTALFVSDFSRERNSPDLLFNGACGSVNYFESSTCGDDMALIADLGPNVPVGSVSASQAFNLRRIAGNENESRFTRSASVALNHTYVVLINKTDVRGLIVFAVTSFEADRGVELDYVVKAYSIQRPLTQSDGFDWERKSDGQ